MSLNLTTVSTVLVVLYFVAMAVWDVVFDHRDARAERGQR